MSLPMWSSFSNNTSDSFLFMNPNSILKRRSVSISVIELIEICKNWINSLELFLAAPSAILTGIDTAALLSCEINPNLSSFGNSFVKLYTFLTKSKLFFQASKFLCGLLLIILIYILNIIQVYNLFSKPILLTSYLLPLTKKNKI